MSDRTERARRIADELRRIDLTDRTAIMAARCGDDAELRAAVERLLDEGQTAPLREAETDTIRQGTASPIQDARPGIPRALAQVGPYELLRRIGRGGMGEVFLGVTSGAQLKQMVAVKVLMAGQDTEDLLRRFNLERQLLAALNHPNIARLFGAGETEDGRPWYAMEYIEGRPITDYCDVHRLRIAERLTLFKDVCSAVHYAHQNLVVHRDIKPSNILVTEDGGVKLLDFGIAKLINPQLDFIREAPTAPEVRVMTPEYASPEQVRGGPITTASDVYSLGVLLYEILSGHRPYRLQSRMREELVRVICEEDPERPSTAVSKVEVFGAADEDPTTDGTGTITPESVSKTREAKPDALRRALSGDIDNIVLMAMRKETQRRYKSAEQFAEDIDRHLDGMPVIARADTLGYRASKFVRRNRWGVSAAAAIGLAVTVGGAGTFVQWRRAKRALEAETAARQEAQVQQAVATAERDRANEVLGQGRGLSRAFLFGVYDKIKQLDGAMPAREFMIETARSYLAWLHGQVDDDPSLIGELADAYDRLGLIEGSVREESAGKTADALGYHEQALALRDELLAAAPDDPLLRHKRATTVRYIGDMHFRSGAFSDAEVRYLEALGVYETLANLEPIYRDQLATTLYDLGKIQIKRGEIDSGLGRYRRSLTLREAILAEDPDDPRSRRRVSFMCRVIGFRLVERGDFEEGDRMYRASGDHAGRVLELQPDSGWAKREVARSHYYCADGLLNQLRPEAALDDLERACAIWAQRYDKNPGNRTTISDYALCHQLRGEALAATERWPEALAAYRQFQAIADDLVALDPKPFNRVQAALARCGVGRALVATGDNGEGIGQCREALDRLERLTVEVPDDVSIAEARASVLRELGDALLRDERSTDALQHYSDAERAYRALLDIEPLNLVLREALAGTLYARAGVAARLGDRNSARAWSREALAILDDGRPSPAGARLRQEIEQDLEQSAGS